MSPDPTEVARRVRAQKVSILTAIRRGQLTAAQVLTEPPAALYGATLWDILRSCPYVGPTRSRRICEAARVWPLSKVEDLTHQEVSEILRLLPQSQRQ